MLYTDINQRLLDQHKEQGRKIKVVRINGCKGDYGVPEGARLQHGFKRK